MSRIAPWGGLASPRCMLNLWGLEGLLAPPLDGIFPLVLMVDPMTMQNCNFLGSLEVPKHLYQSVSDDIQPAV